MAMVVAPLDHEYVFWLSNSITYWSGPVPSRSFHLPVDNISPQSSSPPALVGSPEFQFVYPETSPVVHSHPPAGSE